MNIVQVHMYKYEVLCTMSLHVCTYVLGTMYKQVQAKELLGTSMSELLHSTSAMYTYVHVLFVCSAALLHRTQCQYQRPGPLALALIASTKSSLYLNPNVMMHIL